MEIRSIEELTENYPQVYDTVMDMIEMAINGGYYTNETIDEKFILDYLAEEVASGFIKLTKEEDKDKKANETVTKEYIYKTFVKPNITERLRKFIEDNESSFNIALDIKAKPMILNLSQVTNGNTTLDSLVFDMLYSDTENYYINVERELELREIKTYELVNKFLNENEEIKPIFNCNYYIYDEMVMYYEEYANQNRGIREQATELVVQTILDKCEPNFFELVKDRITVTFD